MIVLIEEIGEGGLELRRELTLTYLEGVLKGEGSADTGFRATGPAELVARLEKVSGGVLLEGETHVAVTTACNRCLADTARTIDVDFELNLVQNVRPAIADEDEGLREESGKRDLEGGSGSFDDASVAEEQFDGRKIDLGGIVREQVLLALPMGALCKESCKGLCTVCGKDLNEGECGCERKVIDPRLAALKNIKLS